MLVEKDHARVLIVKGAAEEILARASSVDIGDGRTSPFTNRRARRCRRSSSEEAAQGNRVLAWRGSRCRGTAAKLLPEDECELIISGFCVFVDPPKPDAAEAIARLASAGFASRFFRGQCCGGTASRRRLGMRLEA